MAMTPLFVVRQRNGAQAIELHELTTGHPTLDATNALRVTLQERCEAHRGGDA